MEIRKVFKCELAHVVRGAYSRRCAMNNHGHSYKVEFFFQSEELDESGMVVDFGRVKNVIGDLVDSFDHSTVLSINESDIIKDFFLEHFERVIITPYTSTAEVQSMMYMLLGQTLMNKAGLEHIRITKVIVHETDTGYAICVPKDLLRYAINLNIAKMPKFSEQIRNEWKSKSLYNEVFKE